jgi:hypothetical protein
MKARMYSEEKHSLLHDHIIDGFAASHEGLRNLKEQGIIKEAEYTQLLEQNVKRLIERVKEFRMAEKMVCIAFAFIFGWMQVGGEDLEMRRSARRSGRRRNETELKYR